MQYPSKKFFKTWPVAGYIKTNCTLLVAKIILYDQPSFIPTFNVTTELVSMTAQMEQITSSRCKGSLQISNTIGFNIPITYVVDSCQNR